MSKKGKNVNAACQAGNENGKSVPRSLEIARKGVQTSCDFALMMSALMSDVVEGLISPGMSNAAVNAGGKMLKCVELSIKYGVQGKGPSKVLQLTPCHDDNALPSVSVKELNG